MKVLGRLAAFGFKGLLVLPLVSASAFAQSVTGACLYSLDPTAQNAFVISGSTAIYSGCGLVVESNATQAFDMQGSETLYLQNHAQVGVVGGWQTTGEYIKDTISNTLVQPIKIASPGDPLASIQAPTSGTIVATSHKYYDMNSKPPNNTIPAGVYCGGLAIGNTNGATFTLSPGTYVMAGGGFTVNSQGIVSGSGVTIYNTSSSGWGCSGSSSYTPIVISGQSKVTLSAPTTGPLAGIVIFGNRTGCATPGNCQDQVNGGSTSNFNGAVYVKSDNLLFSGSNPSGSCMVAVADIITINGNSTFGDTGCAINPVSVSVSPQTTSLYAGQSQQFAATVTNSNNSAVTWSISPSGTGTINSVGLYTAPGSVTTQQNVTVTATSQADTSKSASATVTLLVRQTTPTITWATPAAITYGTALSAMQLNASASVPGTFAYSPAAGTMPGAGTQTLSVTFTPTDTVDYTTATSSVHLTVNKATPGVTWPSPAAIGYGTALSAMQLDASSTVAGSFTYSPAAGTILTAGTQTLSSTFTPTDTTDFTSATSTTSLMVNKASPVIAWTAPAAITYGAALGATQLDATSAVAGSFAYSPSAGTIPPAGTQTLSTTLTPTDMADYATSTSSVALTVNKATPTITWAPSAAITYGSALTAAQLNASSSVPGTFSYAPALGTILPAGTNTLSVTFTPTDTTDYTAASATVSLIVNTATPSVTWPTPAPITYGTALSSTQLNATATIPGTFVYSPALATVLTAGTQTLSVTFTPTDATDYTTVTSTVSFTVNKATPTITWPTPAAISSGTALSAVQLNASSTVTGNFAYSPATGTVLQSGTQTLSVTFTPTDSLDYVTATDAVTLVVNSPPVSVSVNPTSATLNAGQTQQFTATVSNTGNNAVAWTVNPTGTGTVDQTGLYTAPATISTQQTVTVTATSQADPTQSASAVITLTASQCRLNGYMYERAITIDHTKIPNTDQNNFPLLFNTTDPLLAFVGNGGHVSNPNGYDIIFSTDPYGSTKLDHEIEEYNSITGQVIAWVRIPTLSHTTDTVLYVFYGNSNITIPQQNPTGVWDTNYVGVWHVANGTQLSLADSTSNGNNATNAGANATTGQIDGGMLTDGTSYATLGTPTTLADLALGNATFSAWVNTPTGSGGIVMGRDDEDNTAGWALSVDQNGIADFTVVHQDQDFTLSSSTAVGNSRWSYIVATLTGSASSSQGTLYVNGVPSATGAGGQGPTIDDSSLVAYLANATYGYRGYAPFAGSTDEFRISNTIRSADWIAAEYGNQSSPSTFYAFSSEGIAISPISVTLYQSQTQQFTGTTVGSCSAAITWTQTPNGVGTLSTSGLYTAPASITEQATVTITATNQANPSFSASATVTLMPPVNVSVTPVNVTLSDGGQPQQFSAAVLNASNTAVTWTISPTGVGTLTPSGLFTAPATISSAQTLTVTATSQFDSSKSASAIITLTPPTLPSALCTANGYSYERAIVIDHTKVPNSDLVNFPFLFSSASPDFSTTANGGHVTNFNGYDIYFSIDPSGATKLDHELEEYNPTTGQVIAWIRVPAVSHTSDTTIYMFYGNPNVSGSQQNPAGVWDSNYAGVWHVPNGTNLSVADSTVNGNNGINNGATATIGQIDGGFNAGGSGYADVPASSSLADLTQGNATFSAWVKTPIGTNSVFLGKGVFENEWNFGVNPDGTAEFAAIGYGTPFSVTSTQPIGDSMWSYVTVTSANIAGQRQATIYVNGVPSNSASGTVYQPGSDSSQDLYLGKTTYAQPFPGSLDEFRISNIVRSGEWIAAEYANQSSPATFYALNEEDVALSPASVILYNAQSQQFQDLLSASCPINLEWTQSPNGVGNLTQGGLYTAPASITEQSSVTVTATDPNDQNKSGSAVITLMPPVAVSVSPMTATLNDGGQTLQFNSSVLNTSNSSVTWTINPSSIGSIDGTGLYTAPTSVDNIQTVTVTATSQFDPTKSASATITLAPPALPQLQCASTGYAFERSIVIDHNMVSNRDFVDFPFLFNVTDSALAATANGGHVTDYIGNDILFTSDQTGLTKLDFEIEEYNPLTGQLVAWVRIPKLSHSTDTVIYMFYGNSNVSVSPQNPGGVWKSNYQGVWHLPNGTTVSANDSTSNGIRGTLGTGVTATTGEIDGAASFDGSSGGFVSLSGSNAWNFPNDVTVSAWIKTTDNGKGIIDIQNNNPLVYLEVGGTTAGGTANKAVAYFRTDSGGVLIASGTITVNDGKWHHIQAVRSTGNWANVYVDGVLDTSTSYSDTGSIDLSGTGATIGGLGSPYNLIGAIDEVRISNVARSGDWILTEYRNQSSPGSFFAFNPENAQIINPAVVGLHASESQQFVAPAVPGCSAATVLWTMPSGAPGVLSESGLYTAPSSVQTKQSISISATTFGQGGKTYSATVNLLPPVSLSVTPSSATLSAGQTVQFSANVLNTTNLAVNWSVTPAGVGTIDATGLYTAPGSIASQETVTITATSEADFSQSASATITLVPTLPAPPISISINPTSAALQAGQTQQFSATITNATNQGVTWTLSTSGAGTIDANGLYTAPLNLTSQQTVTVTATSQVDSSKSVSAMISLSPTACVASGYAFQRILVINHAKVPNSDQVNFPFLFNSSDPAFANTLNGGHVTSPTGDDIIFSTDPSGITKLDHELEHYDPVSGQVISWVRIPALSHSADTILYIFYGNPNVTTPQQNPAGVWDHSYQGVWHLPNGTTLSANDSTGNTNNGVITNATAAPGEIDGGASFDGSTSVITTSYVQSDVTAYTEEAWISTSSPNAATLVDDRGNGGHSLTFGLDGNGACGSTIGCALRTDPDPTGKLMFGDDAGGVFIGAESGALLNDGAWHHVVGTWSAPAGTSVDPSQFSLYVDGNQVVNPSSVFVYLGDTSPLTGSGGTLIGAGFGNFAGLLDEVRISTTVRSADWVATEYNNQSSSSNFYSLKTETTQSVAPNAVILFPTESQQFTSVGSCNAGITWSMPNGSPGVLSGAGFYTAPPTIAGPQNVIVTATTQSGSSASATVTLMPAVTVNVTPSVVALNSNQTQIFVATLVNASNPAVSWSISPSIGTIDATGLYMAPSSITTQQTVTVTATSMQDVTQSASAIISLQPTQCASTGYGYQRVIVVDHTKVPNSDQTNFPFLFNTTDPELATTANGGHVESTSGYDIFFSTDPSGQNKLDHELEQYDPVTGHVIAWIRIPSLSHSTDTVLYVFYGNPNATGPSQNPTGVWDSNFTAVYHFANQSGLSVADSTSNANNGTPTSVASANGQIDGAANFGGSSSYLQIPQADFPNFPTGQYSDIGLPSTDTTTTYTSTFGVWFKTGVPGGIITQVPALSCSYVFGICFYMGPTEPGYYDPAGWGAMLYVDENGKLVGAGVTSANSYTDNQWHYATMTFTTDGTTTLYVDGASVGAATQNLEGGYSPNYSYFIGTTYTLLSYEGNWDWLYFNGNLDEVNVSKVARSADWIKTQYNNQSSPSTFYKFYPYLGTQVVPPAISLYAAQTQQFAATGLCSGDVGWTMPTNSPGNLSPAGLYTAPEEIATQQTVSITGTNLLTGSSIGTSSVTLLPPAPPIVLTAGGQSPYLTGSAQVFSATLKAADGTPLAGVTLTFDIAGPNSAIGTATTDQTGIATFTYTGNYSGTDLIQASAIVAEIPVTSNQVSAVWMAPVLNAAAAVALRVPPALGVGGLVGAFTDSLGTVVEPVAIGAQPQLFIVPPGATQLQLGINDRYFEDNAGIGFTVAVNGTNVTVPPTTMPWNWNTGTLNSNYEFGLNDGTAPVVAATNLTAGEVVAIAYKSGTVSSGFPLQTLTDANGNPNLITGATEAQGAYFPTVYTTPSTYPLNQPITLNAVVTDASGLPVPGASVSLGIQGANPAQLTATTDSTGTASFMYAGNNSGNDFLVAQATVSGVGLTSGSSNIAWTAYPIPTAGQKLVLSLFGYENDGQVYQVLATDASGNPVANVDVGVYVSGVDNFQMDSQTDITGHAAFGYSHTKAGTYHLVAVESPGRNVVLSSTISGVWNPATVTGGSSSDTVTVSISAPSSVAMPNSLPLTGTVTDSTGIIPTVLWTQVAGPGTVTFAVPTQAVTSATFSGPGIYTLQMSATDTESSATAQISVIVTAAPITINGTPQGWIGAPLYGSTVSGIVPITLAAGITLQSGILTYYPANNPNNFTVLNSTTTGSGQIGILDATTLTNGSYVIQLHSTQTSGDSEYDLVLVTVAGDYKPGRVTSTVTDLVVPATGISIQIQRTYDSLNAVTSGDFGYGWNLSTNVDLVVDPQGDVTFTLGGRRRTFSLTPQSLGSVFSFLYMPVFKGEPGFFGSMSDAGTGCDGGVGLDFVNRNGSIWVCSDGSPFSPTTYVYTDPSGNAYTIGANGGLRSILDKNGNGLTITASGITSTTGLSVPFVRDSSGRITQITDPQGNEYLYSYDNSGNLATVTYPNTPQPSTYTYDPNHLYLSGTDFRNNPLPSTSYFTASDTDPNGLPLNGRLKSVTDGLGEATSYAYDLIAQSTTVTYPPDAGGNVGKATMVYDSLGDLLASTDPLGHTTTNVYDAKRNLISVTDPLGHTTKYTYDSNGNTSSTTYPATATGTTTTSSTIYNGYSEPVSTTDELGNVRNFNYDANYNPQSVTDSQGSLASFLFNSNGTLAAGAIGYDIAANQSKASQFTYDANGNMASRTDALGRATSYTYNSLGQKTSMVEPLPPNSSASAATTSYTYDAFGNLAEADAPMGRTTKSAYDGNSNKTSDTDPRTNVTQYGYDVLNRLNLTTYPDGTTSSKTYDFRGNVVTETDQAGHVTQHTYDLAGRQISMTQAYGTSNATTTTYAYDNAGRKTSETDALSHTTTYTYDAAGNLSGISGVNGSFAYAYDNARNRISMTDGNNNNTQYQYDARKRLVTTTYPDSTTKTNTYDGPGNLISVTDQNGNEVQYAYDAANQLQSVTQTNSPNVPNNITSYGYDVLGDITGLTDANSHLTENAFDLLSQPVSKTLPDGSLTETRQYDPAGNLTSLTHFNGKTSTYTYDALNRLLSRTPDPTTGEPTVSSTYTATGKRASMTDASGTTNYTYDSMDRLITKTTPEGTLNYTYDAAGNLASMTSSHANGVSVSYTYDSLNRLSTVVDGRLAGNQTTTYTYDDANNVANVTYPNSVQTALTYDQLNRLKQLATSQTGYLYTFDAAGNRKTASEYNGRSVAWNFDGIYRLTSESITGAAGGENGTASYSLDPVGNRLSGTSSVPGLAPAAGTFNSDDHLSSESYDSDGNVIASGGKTFSYDTENHLTSMNGSVTNVYDGDGNRVAKTVSGITTRYLVDDLNPTGYAQVVEELSSSGTVPRQYTYGLQRISENQVISNTWTPSFYGYDGFGSVRQLTNSAGTITDTYDYDAFGNKINSTGTTPNNMLYQDEELDPDLGLYYLHARYMNPLTGRFLSRDPGDGEYSNPATLHKYLYADGDPVNGFDPTGLEDAEAYPLLLGRISVSAEAVAGLEALKAAIACALIWEGTKTYAEIVAGPFGTVEQVSPCLVMGRKPKATPIPPVPIPIPRSIPQPQPPRKGCTCTCRADADDTMPGNITPGLPLFAFGTATAPSCQDASKEAKSIAIHTLRMKPKHVGCRCAEK